MRDEFGIGDDHADAIAIRGDERTRIVRAAKQFRLQRQDDAPARLPTIAVAASASFFSVSRGRVGKENDDRVTRLRRRRLLGHFLRRLRCFQVLLRNRFDRGRQIAGDRAGERIARIAAGDEFRGSADEERERLSTFVERRRAFGQHARTARRCFVLTFRGAIEFVRGLREQRDRERFLCTAADVGVASKRQFEHRGCATTPRLAVAADGIQQLRRIVVSPFAYRHLGRSQRHFVPIRERFVRRREMRLGIAQHSELPEEDARIAARDRRSALRERLRRGIAFSIERIEHRRDLGRGDVQRAKIRRVRILAHIHDRELGAQRRDDREALRARRVRAARSPASRATSARSSITMVLLRRTSATQRLRIVQPLLVPRDPSEEQQRLGVVRVEFQRLFERCARAGAVAADQLRAAEHLQRDPLRIGVEVRHAVAQQLDRVVVLCRFERDRAEVQVGERQRRIAGERLAILLLRAVGLAGREKEEAEVVVRGRCRRRASPLSDTRRSPRTTSAASDRSRRGSRTRGR